MASLSSSTLPSSRYYCKNSLSDFQELLSFPGNIKLHICSTQPTKFVDRKLQIDESSEELITVAHPFLVFSGPRGQFTINCSSFLPFFNIYCIVQKKKINQVQENQSFLFLQINNQSFSLNPARFSKERIQIQRKIRSFRNIVKTIIQGLTVGFTKSLRTGSPGTKFSLQNNTLLINTGISHVTGIICPKSLILFSESPTELTIFGISKEEVSQFAAHIRNQLFEKRAYSPPHVHYDGEIIKKKNTRKK